MKNRIFSFSKYLVISCAFFFILDLFSGFVLAGMKPNPIFWSLFPEEFSILAQTSKKSLKPAKPVLILGDSYAAGMGDWYSSQKQQLQIERFHSAHILHQKISKDVISLGQVGAGSPQAIVGQIQNNYRAFNQSWLYKIEKPSSIIIYFYEGNDLQDNIEWIAGKSNCATAFDDSRKNDTTYIKQYIQQHAVKPNTESSTAIDLIRNFHISYAIYKRLTAPPVNKPDGYQCSPYKRFGRVMPIVPGNINHALINSTSTQIADHIQAAPVELNTQQYAFATEVFKQSLILLKEAYPDTPIGVLYIPSVASSYHISSSQIIHQNYLGPEPLSHSKDLLEAAHQKTLKQIFNIANELNMPFYDATAFIQDASSKEVIHGPTDWNHLNKKGYQALGLAAAQLYQKMNQQIPMTSNQKL